MHKQLNKKEIRELNQKVNELYSLEDFIPKKTRTEIKEDIIYIENKAIFFLHDNKPTLLLKAIIENNELFNCIKKVTVDMGAIKFVTAGADIMRPGITKMDEFDKDDFVLIIDETHNKPLAIGIAMFSSEEMNNMNSGKVLNNIHYIGDEMWR